MNSQVLLGALVVLVGLLLLLETTDVYDARFLLEYVPSLFVLLGLYALVRSGFRNVFGPVVIVATAAAWQLVALDVVEWSDVTDLWPLFLVLFGLSLILSQWRSPSGFGRGFTRRDESAGSYVSSLAIFGGSEQHSTSKEFTGANLTAVFGGAELDLRDAAVADPPAHVSAVAAFGGVSIIVPRDWNVEMDVLPVLGAATDERREARPEGESRNGRAAEPRGSEREGVDLVVSGFAAFGGISVED